MRFQTVIIAVATLFLSISGAQSQNRTGRAGSGKQLTKEQRIDRRVESLNQSLKLDEQQLKKIRTIITNSSDLLQSAASAHNTESMKQIRTQTNDAISKVLTSVQNEQYKVLQEQRKSKQRATHTTPSVKYIDKLRTELDLTEAQAKEIEQVMVKSNSDVRKLKAQTHSQIQSLLNDTQKAKFAELKKGNKKSKRTTEK